MKPMFRTCERVPGALVVLGALPGLAGCSPAALPLTAVGSVGGEPVVLLASCRDFAIDAIVFRTSTTDMTASVDGPDRRIERTGSVVPESMPLLGDPPPGWTVTDSRLSELTADGHYGLAAYDRASPTVDIGFAAADLAALGPGEVLVGKGPNGHRKVTEQDFRKQAEKAC